MPTPPKDVLPDAIRAFLAAPRFATIATVAVDGAPHQAVTWYLLDRGRLIINSRRERHWPRNLLRDPRISIAIHDHDRLGHWVGIRGQATLLHEGSAALDDIASMAHRYGGDPQAYAGQDRLSFAVTVERTYEYWS